MKKLIAMTLLLLFCTACTAQPGGEAGTTTTAAETTTAPTAAERTSVPTEAADSAAKMSAEEKRRFLGRKIKAQLPEMPRFEEIKAEYGLQMERDAASACYARSGNDPSFFRFSKEGDDSGESRLLQVGGSAFALLPEYVGLPLAKIPFTMQEGKNKWVYHLYDDKLHYTVTLSKTGVLNEDDWVCVAKNNPEKSGDSAAVSDGKTNGILTVEKAKDLIARRPTFEELEAEYDLWVDGASEFGGLDTKSATMPDDVEFHFRDDAKSTRLLYIGVPAHIIFPDYVNTRIEEMPFTVEKISQGEYHMYDDTLLYVLRTDDSGILIANAWVSVEKSVREQ